MSLPAPAPTGTPHAPPTSSSAPASSGHQGNVYILIAQCLQNGFFLADENRLCLPGDVAMRLLVGMQASAAESYKMRELLDEIGSDNPQRNLMGKATRQRIQETFRRVWVRDPQLHNRRRIHDGLVQQGPLYSFLKALIDDKSRTAQDSQHWLHFINIKDWHVPSDSYDEERRLYGSHCEAGTWEADSLEGFDAYLKPWGSSPDGERQAVQDVAGYAVPGKRMTFYEVRSDSIYDFRPEALRDSRQTPSERKDSRLEKILDSVILEHPEKRIYIVVLGVYADIKIRTLLMGLRSRYHIHGLALSDVLTAAPTLERHLEALDFAAKVLNVEVVHSLNELITLLNPNDAPTLSPEVIPADLTAASINFRDYRTYFLDKQNVLAFQDQKLLEYFELTSRRSLQVYNRIATSNWVLMRFGFFMLAITAILIGMRIVDPDRIGLELIAITGGLSLIQIITAFFNRPANQLQENLKNLVRLRNYLETYSLITALLRHHFTAPEHLANRNLDELRKQMEIVQQVAAQMSSNFRDISIGTTLDGVLDDLDGGG